MGLFDMIGEAASDFGNWLFGSSKAEDVASQGLQDAKQFQQKIENEYGVGEAVKNPSNFVNNIASQYKGSDYENYISNQTNTALNNQLNATGLAGSSYGLGAVGRLNSDLAGSGLSNFVNSTLGAYQGNLSGLLNSNGGTLGALGNYTDILNQQRKTSNENAGAIGKGIITGAGAGLTGGWSAVLPGLLGLWTGNNVGTGASK